MEDKRCKDEWPLRCVFACEHSGSVDAIGGLAKRFMGRRGKEINLQDVYKDEGLSWPHGCGSPYFECKMETIIEVGGERGTVG